MPPQLLALNEGPSIVLDKPILLVGRHEECDIQLPSRKISRRHCCIAQVKDYLVVRDLSSTNGIRINGVRVLEGCLRPGDELAIGNFRYQFRWDSLAGGQAPSPAVHEGIRRPRPIPRGPSEDSLESCDVPVPLTEPAGSAHRPGDVPVGLPPAGYKPGKHSPPPAPSHPLILPDDLQLAPSGSDMKPPPALP